MDAQSNVSFYSVAFVLLALFLFFLCFLGRKVFLYKCKCDVCEAYLCMSWKKTFRNLCDWQSYLLENSPSKTIHIHVLNNIITANPANVEHILKTNFHNYPKGKQFSSILGDLLGRGIFNVDGNLWKFQKNLASFELNKSSIRLYAFDVVRSEISDWLVPLLEETTAGLDVQDVFQKFSFNVICRFSFGLDPRRMNSALYSSDFATSFDVASKLSATRAFKVYPLIWKLQRAFNFGAEKKMKEANKIINKIATDIIAQRRSSMGELSTNRKQDLLSRFMHSVDNDAFLRDIVVNFLLAGRDSVASALTSFFWLIEKHPEVAKSILDEADEVLGQWKEPQTFEEMRNLHYLQAAVYESMRLFPPIQMDSKFSVGDDMLPDGSFVKRGTRVAYHPYSMGRMTEIWGSDCLKFKPERWLKEGVFMPMNPYKFPVFQAGARVCLGKEMAVLEVKLVALSLIRRFHFQSSSTYHTPTPLFSPGLTATYQNGFTLIITGR